MPTIAATLASHTKKIDSLTKKAAKQKTELDDLKQRVKLIEKWCSLETAWTSEVTGMLHQIDWGALQTAFPGGGGTNPPKSGPDWPPK